MNILSESHYQYTITSHKHLISAFHTHWILISHSHNNYIQLQLYYYWSLYLYLLTVTLWIYWYNHMTSIILQSFNYDTILLLQTAKGKFCHTVTVKISIYCNIFKLTQLHCSYIVKITVWMCYLIGISSILSKQDYYYTI